MVSCKVIYFGVLSTGRVQHDLLFRARNLFSSESSQVTSQEKLMQKKLINFLELWFLNDMYNLHLFAPVVCFFSRSHFPSLGNFVNKKVKIEKKDHFYDISFKSSILGGLNFFEFQHFY